MLDTIDIGIAKADVSQPPRRVLSTEPVRRGSSLTVDVISPSTAIALNSVPFDASDNDLKNTKMLVLTEKKKPEHTVQAGRPGS